MNNQPLISVSIPIYNAMPYLPEALDSLLNQSYQNLEIICVNDGSTDDSLDCLKRYADKDSRIKIIDGPNGGYGKAMNKGLMAASGKYFAIFEPDDILPLNAYSTLIEMAEKHNLDIAKGCIARFYEKDGERVVEPDYSVEEGRLICPRKYMQCFKFDMCTVTCLYNLDFLHKHNIRYNETPGASYQDNGMYMLSFAYAERLMCVKEIVYLYRIDNLNSSIHQFSSKPYAMRDEFTYIRQRLMETPDVWDTVKGAWLYLRWSAHNNTFLKICNSIKMEYLHDLRQELLSCERFDTSLMLYWMRDDFYNLMVSPEYMMAQRQINSLYDSLSGCLVRETKQSSSWFGIPLFMIKRKELSARYLLLGFLPVWEKRIRNNVKQYRLFGVNVYISWLPFSDRQKSFLSHHR
ncbi:MAG: glycosyltransferase, partial [Akkermansia sp.]|nr:glycosyltransferase [Akkermansia sp.]